MKKTLYLMRHGETVFNKQDLVQGACDSPLTEVGRTQPLYAKRWFADQGIKFDHAYASTQERASDTLELITEMPYQRLKGIKEMSFGIFEATPNRFVRAACNLHENPEALTKFGGEGMYAVQNRVVNTLTELMKKPDHQTVLAVSHGCAIFTFAYKWIAGITWEKFHLTNCVILKFEYEDEQFKFIEMINHDFDQPLT